MLRFKTQHERWAWEAGEEPDERDEDEMEWKYEDGPLEDEDRLFFRDDESETS